MNTGGTAVMRRSSVQRWALLVAFLPMALAALAQQGVDNVMVHGTVKDYVTRLPLPGAEVVIYQDEVRVFQALTDSLGRYETFLEFDHTYKLWYMQAGKVTKHVVVDTRGIPVPDRAGGYGMNVDITLFKNLPGLDLPIMAQPMGMASYSPADSSLVWDLEHTERMRADIQAGMQRYDSLRVLEEKR